MSTILPANAFPALLELLPSGVVYYLPVTDATGTVTDFTFAYLNPAAQRILQLPERPTVTYAQHFTQADVDGLAFHRAAYQQAGPMHRTGYYQADGYDAHYTMQAQRVNDALLVHFTVATATDQPAFDAARQAQQAQALAAHQAVETQRDELTRLLEQAPVAMAILTGPELRIDLANTAVGAIWGRPPAQVLGRPYFEALPETAGQGFEQILAGVLATGQPFFVTEAPVRLPRLENGQPVQAFVNFSFHALRDAQHQIISVLALGIEITEQVRARQQVERLNQELEAQVQARTQEVEAARAAAERQRGELERVFEQAPVAIAVYRGPSYTIELANPTVARLWGRTQEQLLGKGLFEALPEVAGMGYEELLDHVMATGEPHVAHAMEAQHDRNGQRETVYWDFVYVPMHAADGHINGAMVVATEVTQQVRARQQVEQLNQELETRVRERTRQLSEQQQLLSRILGQVPAAIATTSGPEHRYTFFNSFYQHEINHRAVLGKSVAEALPEVVDLGFVAILDQVYATGELYQGWEVPFQLHDMTADGQLTHYVNFVYQPLMDGHGHTTGVLVFALDVTEQVLARQLVENSQQQVQGLNEELAAINEELRATNEELHKINGQLRRTNTDLDTFVYTASHDLKAPIANIEGLLLALHRNLPAPVAQEPLVARLLVLMQDAVGRFQQTIGHLTNIVQLQQFEAPETVDLPALVADVQLDLSPLLEATGAQFSVQLEACEAVHVAPKTVRSVLYNLLSNALKYRALDRTPWVQLRARCTSDHIVVQVEDNGLGLSEDQQTRLFGLFRRLHTHVEGSGVGLYMVKRLIENAGGSITVQSAPDTGSIFTVSLPL